MKFTPVPKQGIPLYRIAYTGCSETLIPVKRNLQMMCVDSRNINQIAKAANTYGWVNEKVIADMKAEHEKVLETVKEYFDKLLEIM